MESTTNHHKDVKILMILIDGVADYQGIYLSLLSYQYNQIIFIYIIFSSSIILRIIIQETSCKNIGFW